MTDGYALSRPACLNGGRVSLRGARRWGGARVGGDDRTFSWVSQNGLHHQLNGVAEAAVFQIVVSRRIKILKRNLAVGSRFGTNNAHAQAWWKRRPSSFLSTARWSRRVAASSMR